MFNYVSKTKFMGEPF